MFKPERLPNVDIMIVGEIIGDREEAEGKAFVGTSGWELTRMLQEARITRTSCFLTYVCRERAPKNQFESFVALKKKDRTEGHIPFQGALVLPPVVEGIEALREEIRFARPNVIVALGEWALWALTGNRGIMKWRGSMLYYTDPETGHKTKVIPTYAPAKVIANWSWRPVVIRDFRRALTESKTAEYSIPDYSFIVRPSFETAFQCLSDLLAKVEAGPLKVSVDIETRAGHIACIGIAWSPTEAICIPLMCVERPTGYWMDAEEVSLCWLIYQLLTHPNIEVIGQNFLYDMQYFHRHLCFIPVSVRDTMLAQHVCFSTMKKGLDYLSSMYCVYHVYWKDEGKNWNDKIDEDAYWIYNCKDAVSTFEIDSVERRTIEQMRLTEQDAFQQSMIYPVLDTLNRGVLVDYARREEMDRELSSQMAAKQEWLTNVLGYPLNPRSPVQVINLFYKQLEQRPIKSRKTGGLSTDDEALHKIASREPLLAPLCETILDYRSLGVTLSTFIRAGLDIDGRLRCYYNIAGTDTYRFASGENAFGTGLNFQNIPAEVRKIFIPDPGYEFFDLDLSSADLRIVVAEANEPEMRALLDAGLNPYVEVAKEHYKDPSITKNHPKYRIFKSFAHGTHYLGTPDGMAGKLGMTVHQCEQLQKWYFGRFPRIRQWQDDFKAKVTNKRMVENCFGYRYYIFDRIDGRVINQAIAWLPQSTIALLINRIWKNIFDNHSDLIEILLQVHDSLGGQYPIERRDEAIAAINRSADIWLPYPNPIQIPIGLKTSAKSWGDCE